MISIRLWVDRFRMYIFHIFRTFLQVVEVRWFRMGDMNFGFRKYGAASKCSGIFLG